jgi:long-chain acyl-CoA synthetase
MFRYFVTLEVKGVDTLKNLKGPVFFVSNHLSYLDQPAVMYSLSRELRYRTATAAWEEFFFGEYHGVDKVLRRLSYEYGTVLLNLFPLPQSQGFSGSLAYMGKLADAGFNILIFPEGGHSRDGKMQPFQLGLGIMVKELGIPVVPIKIRGTDQVLPHEANFPKKGQVTVTFGEPLRFSYETPAEIVENTRRAVERL